MPLIMTHGWPGSVFELLNVIGPLTDPTAHGGVVQDAFDLVLPSIPGFGFSQKPKGAGWNPERVARAWDVLMTRLGYQSYVSQGGDWGAIISEAMGRQAPAGLRGIHVNRVERATTIPPDVAKALKNGDPAPAGLTGEERQVFDEARDFLSKGFGYAAIMGTRPETIGFGLSDSPVGLAAWIYDKIEDWVFTRGEAQRSLSRDAILDNITFYWLTNTGPSSARIYWENNNSSSKPDDFSRRGLQATEKLDCSSLPQSDLLQPSGQRRSFRGLGTTGSVQHRGARCLSTPAMTCPDGRALRTRLG
jgi:pimeloyl-ACP methyl ester carboxylesterase